jgi:spermidine/putrescine transport system permease protein
MNLPRNSLPLPIKCSFWAAALFLIVFFLFPLLVVFGVSLASRGLYGGVEWIGTLENYRRLADPLIGGIFLRSILFASVTTLVCAVAGFPLAYAVARASHRWQLVLLILVMIPFWTNFLVRTYAWVLILRADGLFNSLLIQLGIQSEPLALLFTDFAVGVGLIYGFAVDRGHRTYLSPIRGSGL